MTQVEFLDAETIVSESYSGWTCVEDVKTGQAKLHVSGLVNGCFPFSKENRTEQEMARHMITVEGDLVLVHAMDEDKDKKTAPVAFFRAPSPIHTLRVRASTSRWAAERSRPCDTASVPFIYSNT